MTTEPEVLGLVSDRLLESSSLGDCRLCNVNIDASATFSIISSV